ncbi:MAG: Rrf2 family transcriptional regulator [Deltaproteobacteria bacterium]|nr:Rrf2 family transcriptional regulator [Deltaproteobacteria bacterium]
MKLSTRSRYGTRLMADLAEHLDSGPIQLGDIAQRQGISVKYLEQLIIPLKKANWIKSARGPKGGHILAVSPHDITIGEIVSVLESEVTLTHCLDDPETCERHDTCKTREVWIKATKAIQDTLHAVKLSEIMK